VTAAGRGRGLVRHVDGGRGRRPETPHDPCPPTSLTPKTASGRRSIPEWLGPRWLRFYSLAVEASGRLVGPPVFKTGEGLKSPWRVRFPSASATASADPPGPMPSPRQRLRRCCGGFDSRPPPLLRSDDAGDSDGRGIT